MFRGDDRPLGAAGLNELPPYYSKRLQVAGTPDHDSVRTEQHNADADAQAERLFRDFKLGLLTLVVVALLLLAYFWDGEGPNVNPGANGREDVLSFSLRGARRSEVMPAPAVVYAGSDQPVRPQPAVAEQEPRTQANPAPVPAERREVRGVSYTVRQGDTLSGIALQFYGDAAHWKDILQANRSRLQRPADLRPGMKLVVPVRTSRASDQTEGSPHLARASPVVRR
jgi:hypothetical protein